MAERRNRGRRDKRVGENNCCVVVGARHHPGGLSGGCPSSSKTTPRQVMVGMPPVKVRVLDSEREIQMAKCAQLGWGQNQAWHRICSMSICIPEMPCCAGARGEQKGTEQVLFVWLLWVLFCLCFEGCASFNLV